MKKLFGNLWSNRLVACFLGKNFCQSKYLFGSGLSRSGFIIGVVIIMSGCEIGGSGGNPPVAEMLPDLPGYTVVEGETLTDYLGKISGGAALLAGQPQLAVTIAAVDEIIGCYQEVGGVRARVYSHEENPLSVGAVAIADRNVLLDPLNLFTCVAPVVEIQAKKVTIEPCKANYTLTRDDNEFYILYAGATTEICQAFCAQLEGCTAHE